MKRKEGDRQGDGTSAPAVEDLAHRVEFARQWQAAHDPAVASLVGRQMKAFAELVLGAGGAAPQAPEPIVSAGFESTAAEAHRVREIAIREDRDVLHLTFNLDSQAKPTGLMLAFREGDGTSLHSRAWPWTPAEGGRAIIVSQFGEADARLGFRPRRGRRMVRTTGWPADDLYDGVQRAALAWERLLASDASGGQLVAMHQVGRVDGAGVPHLRLGRGDGAPPPPAGRGLCAWFRSEEDERDVAEEAFCRAFCVTDPFVASRMEAYASALAVGLSGRRGTRRPEPLLQAGFEPTGRHETVALADAAILHVLAFHFASLPRSPGGPRADRPVRRRAAAGIGTRGRKRLVLCMGEPWPPTALV